ncbi:hypothetical protein [Metallosphaera sp.]
MLVLVDGLDTLYEPVVPRVGADVILTHHVQVSPDGRPDSENVTTY